MFIDFFVDKFVRFHINSTYGLANRCASHAELEDILYGYARPKTALNMKQVNKIAYFSLALALALARSLEIKTKNENRIVVAHLNINFINQKFEALKTLVNNNVDILMISETKIAESFPSKQFQIDDFSSPFRLDMDRFGGGIYIRQDLLCKELTYHNRPENMETIFTEVNFCKTKYILIGGYNPKTEYISDFLSHLSKGIDTYISKYDNILILGDLNAEMINEAMADFWQMYNLTNIIKEPICYKNPINPSSIDVILTNRKRSISNSITIETGLSDSQNDFNCSINIHQKKRTRSNKLQKL